MLHPIDGRLRNLIEAEDWDEVTEAAIAGHTVDADEVDVEATADALALAYDELRRWRKETQEIASHYAARAAALRRREEFVRGLLERLLRDEGVRSMRTPHATVSLARSSRPAVTVADPEALPPELRVAVWRPKTDALLALYHVGEPLPPGVEVKQGEHVRVRLGGAPPRRRAEGPR